ncbi:MAG: DNA gyrase inhibitor YacG [Isosphaeraceae bacterium]
MIRGRCPICSKTFTVAKLDDLPPFPFCSDRCRLIDLGRWIDGAYAVPVGSSAGAEEEDEASAAERVADDDEPDGILELSPPSVECVKLATVHRPVRPARFRYSPTPPAPARPLP